jgi:predicted ATPase/class 3 adenylate cyclase
VSACASCGNELPGAFPFCPFCAAPLSEAPLAPSREERKVVSCLFCDLVGFTARAERLDPEDVRAFLSPYHARLRSELERFGGTVEKFIGDAVMALFGAPVTHEDDPERAVRAALAIRDWVAEQGEELQVRIAVATGEALVALGARPSEGEGMASGDVVNTAARLQAAAPVNGILVDEWTRRATRDTIVYHDAEPVGAKGKAAPIPVSVAVRPRARVGIERGHDALLVGRSEEVGLLMDALARVKRDRSAQLVTIVGVPGIGKSRLVYELLRSVEGGGELVTWRHGRALPYGAAVTFWPLAEMVKGQAGILESDSAAEAEAKLRAAVAAVDAPDPEWVESQLRPLVGLGAAGGPSEAGRSEAFAAWRQFFESLAELRPLVLVFEDLHWADGGVLDFVDHLVEWASGVPMLVVCTARPELLSRHVGWGGGKSNTATISLSPLSDEQTAKLLGSLLQRAALPAETQTTLLAVAGGNPLYAEQYARMLAERGRGEALELPETVQGIIAARVDGLSPEEKALLQDASVVGRVFWLGAVAAIGSRDRWQTEELLHALERKEFVRRERRSSVGGDTEYAFRHLLVRDVAYGQIPRGERADKHRRAAEWIGSLGRPEDHAETLAHHWQTALALAEAAGLDTAALGESARHALRDAGDRAAALYAVDTAERFYDAALRLWPEDDPERAQLLFCRAAPVRSWGGGDPERLAEATDALLAAGDNARAAEAETLLSVTFRMQGRRELSDEHGDRALAFLADTRPSRSSAWVLARQARRALLVGQFERAIELGQQARVQAEQLGWEEGLSEALDLLGSTRGLMGDRRGLEDLARSVEIATAAGALGALSLAYNSLAATHQVLGDLDAAYAARLEGARVAERLGSASEIRWFEGVLTDHHYRRGEWDEAIRMADGFLVAVEAGSPHYSAWQVYAIRAEMRLGQGDAAGAIRDAESALVAGRAVAEPQALYFVLPACAHVFSHASGRDRAVPLAREFLDALNRGVGMQFAVINLPTFASAAFRLELAQELVDALADHPRTPWTETVRAYAHGDFVAAAEILHRTGAKPEEAEARLRAAEQLMAKGSAAEADEQLQQALKFYRSVGATYYVRECEARLAAP